MKVVVYGCLRVKGHIPLPVVPSLCLSASLSPPAAAVSLSSGHGSLVAPPFALPPSYSETPPSSASHGIAEVPHPGFEAADDLKNTRKDGNKG